MRGDHARPERGGTGGPCPGGGQVARVASRTLALTLASGAVPPPDTLADPRGRTGGGWPTAYLLFFVLYPAGTLNTSSGTASVETFVRVVVIVDPPILFIMAASMPDPSNRICSSDA